MYNNLYKLLCSFIIILLSINYVNCWDNDELEVFDVVDDVKENFYNLLNVSQEASNQEIKSAFRSLSLKLHPDKNPDVDTSEQFRNLVAVYEVLRSPNKRKIYNDVLVNGLPNWRSAVYYYRYVRKMGITETLVILFIILTIGQYLVKWAAYLEKKYEQSVAKKPKRGEKVIIEIPKPSIFETLPFQIPKLLFYLVVSLPYSIKQALEEIKEQRQAAIIEKEEREKEEAELAVPRVKTVRKRNKFQIPEGPNFEIPNQARPVVKDESGHQVPVSGGFWSDDDLADLIRLVKKYPQGTPGRWESIAEALNRSIPEVTFMANRMKENAYKLPSDQETEVVPIKIKQKTKKLDEINEEDVKKWSQVQQKALEEALIKYPKGCAERWERVASCVPGKSKEECTMRIKYLAEMVRKQREQPEETADS